MLREIPLETLLLRNTQYSLVTKQYHHKTRKKFPNVIVNKPIIILYEGTNKKETEQTQNNVSIDDTLYTYFIFLSFILR